jgi:hypothetical protein
MAAKHDGKRAQANMWVTHQNLARQKGGRPAYQAPVKKAKKAAPAPAPTAETTGKDATSATDATDAKSGSEG